jgi:uncharacterized membrane protein (DUF2068 family)
MNQRPDGVTLIAIIFIGLGILSLLWSGLVFGVGGLSSLFASIFNAESIAEFGTTSTWVGFLGILAAALQIVAGFGLLALKKWAWILALISIAVTIVQGVVGMLSNGLFIFLCGIFGLLIPIAMLIYLLRRETRANFGMS